MLFQQNLIVEQREANIRTQIDLYMKDNRYTRIASPGSLIYQRGLKLGSWAALRSRDFQANVTIQVWRRTYADCQVEIVFDVDTCDQWVLEKDRQYWMKEMNSLATFLGGRIDPGTAPTDQGSQERLRWLENQLRGSASFFFWIAGMSLLNTLIFLFGGQRTLIFGLGTTQFIDGYMSGIANQMPAFAAFTLTLLRLGLDGLISMIFAFFGIEGLKQKKTAFLIGSALYFLDTLVFVWAGDFKSVLFHLVALAGLSLGLPAVKELNKTRSTHTSTPTVPLTSLRETNLTTSRSV